LHSLNTSFNEHASSKKHIRNKQNLSIYRCERLSEEDVLSSELVPNLPLLQEESGTTSNSSPIALLVNTPADLYTFSIVQQQAFKYAQIPPTSSPVGFMTAGLHFLIEKFHITETEFVQLCNFLSNNKFSTEDIPSKPNKFHRKWKGFTISNDMLISDGCPTAVPLLRVVSPSTGITCHLRDPCTVIKHLLNNPATNLPTPIIPSKSVDGIVKVEHLSL
jgi:hypothetical protein